MPYGSRPETGEEPLRPRFTRLALRIPVEITTLPGGGLTCTGHTLNVSSSGALIELEPGAGVPAGEVAFVLRLKSRPVVAPDVYCHGRVVRQEQRDALDAIAVTIDSHRPLTATGGQHPAV